MHIDIRNPLRVKDWDTLIRHFDDVNIFHTSMWAAVLTRTYRYTPYYLVGIQNGQYKAVMPLMQAVSPFTGRRGVSLPFTDACSPLIPKKTKKAVWEKTMALAESNHWHYIEIRSGHLLNSATPVSTQFYEHQIILDTTPDTLFKNMQSSTRRNIRKAEKSGVTIKHHYSLDAIKLFYRLHAITRKRHGMPVQPWKFFKNICNCIIEKNQGFISVAYHKDQPVAASVYFFFGKNALYKFGASDLKFQHVRPNDLIQWDAIKHFQKMGFNSLSLGRTDWGHEGLRSYKLGLGAEESIIQYHKYDLRKNLFIQADPENESSGLHMKNVPIFVLKIIGKFAYKHAA